MDILQLYRDYNVDHATEGHRHCQPGWVNVECPFCTGNPGYHLGYNMEEDYFHCWRCGGHPIIETIGELINKPRKEVKKIVKQYDAILPTTPRVKVKVRRKVLKLPSDLIPLTAYHRRYLEQRGFDPDELINTWKIQSTGPLSRLDDISYRNRIFIPIHWDNRLASFTTRAARDVEFKYISAPEDREDPPHKTILYGIQTGWTRTGVVTEGPTDVWRFGKRACGTFGIQYKPQQVRLLSQRFDRVAVVFDPDPQAIIQANRLVAELRFRGTDAWRVDIPTDPGDMPQDEADYLIKQLI